MHHISPWQHTTGKHANVLTDRSDSTHRPTQDPFRTKHIARLVDKIALTGFELNTNKTRFMNGMVEGHSPKDCVLELEAEGNIYMQNM
jgi:hypothetical protein